MCATCTFSAPPNPTTASLMARGAYSNTGMALRHGAQRGTACVTELQRAIDVAIHEHALDGDLIRLVLLDELCTPCEDLRAAAPLSVPSVGAMQPCATCALSRRCIR